MAYIIIVGIDQSQMSQVALQEALQLASQRGQLHVVHCVEQGPLAERAPHSTDDPTTGPERQEIERFVNETNVNAIPLELHVLFGGPAQDQLCDLAYKLEADLLIVGAQGERGYSRMWMGSCAQNVIRNAPCSVLVVRPKASRTTSSLPASHSKSAPNVP